MLPGESGTPPGGNSLRAGLGRKRGEAKGRGRQSQSQQAEVGVCLAGTWVGKQARDLAEGTGGTGQTEALRHQSSFLIWLRGEAESSAEHFPSHCPDEQCLAGLCQGCFTGGLGKTQKCYLQPCPDTGDPRS